MPSYPSGFLSGDAGTGRPSTALGLAVVGIYGATSCAVSPRTSELGADGAGGVWEVVSVWRDYTPDREAFYDHFPPYIDRVVLDQALAYAERFEGEIGAMIRHNERLEQLVSRQG